MESYLRDEIMALTPAERHQVFRHQEAMSGMFNEVVSYEAAAADWLANSAHEWREERFRRMMALQRKHINEYKWIRSEEAGCDLGPVAIIDWIKMYAPSFREWFEREYETMDPPMVC